jgi:hypothetical protein
MVLVLSVKVTLAMFSLLIFGTAQWGAGQLPQSRVVEKYLRPQSQRT